MNMKKIIAGIAATVAATAMVVSASAKTVDYTATSPEAGGKPETGAIFLETLGIDTEAVDGSKVAKVEVDMTWETAGNGFMGANDLNATWIDTAQVNVDEPGDVTWTLETAGGIDVATFKIEFWWINPTYDEDGNPNGAGNVKINAIRMLDANGADLLEPATEAPEATDAPEATEAPATEAPTVGGSSGDVDGGNDNPGTGVAVAVAPAVLAAGALAAAAVIRKRK